MVCATVSVTGSRTTLDSIQSGSHREDEEVMSCDELKAKSDVPHKHFFKYLRLGEFYYSTFKESSGTRQLQKEKTEVDK